MNNWIRNLGLGLLLLLIYGLAPNYALAVKEYSAEWVAQSEKVSLKSGDTGQVWVEMKNTGTATWLNSGSNAIKLGTVRKRDRGSVLYSSSWLSNNRLATMQQTQVLPGEVAHFDFTVTAGAGKGTIKEYFGLVAEGITWLPETEFSLEVAVLPTVFSGQVVSTIAPIVLKTGLTQQVTVSIKNTGDVTWNYQGPCAVKIGTAGPFDRRSAFYTTSWLSNNRVVTVRKNIAPGETEEFSWTIAAPSKIGQYQEKFSLVAEKITWFKDVNLIFNIKVDPAIYSASLVSKSDNPILTPGESATINVELRNNGNTTWTNSGDRPAKLGTAKPLDRKSDFYDPTWPGENRAALIDKEVAPGEVGKFSFVIKAPDKIGVYKEYFRPLIEHTTWMEDVGIYWEINVNEELVLKSPIRVGLNYINNPITIINSGGLVVRAGDEKKLIMRVPANQSLIVTINSSSYGIDLSGTTTTVDNYLKFIPLKDSMITVNSDQISGIYSRFRGIIIVKKSALSGRTWVVNELELEDYLRGVAEVPSNWPLEARKAQAIAARTFALRRIQTPKADIFDIYDDTKDQVYYGYSYEVNMPGITEATEATRGIIVRYSGQPALTYYHSDSGGGTDNVEDIWSRGDISKAVPYLKAVIDPYAKPVTWEATLAQGYMQEAFQDTLAKAGAASETVTDIIINERYPSGRLKTATLVTSTGKRVTVDLLTFDSNTDGSYVKSMNFTVSKTGSNDAPDFVLSGKGNGHGIGLSQWSAYNMASAGKTYDEILKFFYLGVEVGSI